MWTPSARRRTRLLATLVAHVALFAAPCVQAQVFVGPSKVYRVTIPIPVNQELSLDKLDKEFRAGNWQKSLAEARVLLGALAEQDAEDRRTHCCRGLTSQDCERRLRDAAQPECSDQLGTHLGDLDKGYYNVLWESTGKDGKATLARILLHRGIKPEHASELPGLTEANTPLIDVFLSPSSLTPFTSSYISVEQPNASAAQLADFVGRIPLIPFLAKASGRAGPLADNGDPVADARDELRSITVTVNEFDFPTARAKLTGTYVVVPIQSPADFVKATRALVAVPTAADPAPKSVMIREALSSLCARGAAKEIADRVVKAAAEKPCNVSSSGAPVEDLFKRGETCGKHLNAAISAGYAHAVLELACQTGALESPAEAAVRVEQRFRQVVSGPGDPLRVEAEIANVPPVTYSFGLMTGLVLGRSSLSDNHPRVKLEGGKIVDDAFERHLTLAVVNLHPWGYRSTSRRMSFRERARFFAGATLTPDFGFTAGLGCGIIRGLAVNVGGALVLSDTLREGDTIGGAPNDRRNAFKTRSHAMGVFGLSYTFK